MFLTQQRNKEMLHGAVIDTAQENGKHMSDERTDTNERIACTSACIEENDRHPEEAIEYPVGYVEDSDGVYGLFTPVEIDDRVGLQCCGVCRDCGADIVVMFTRTSVQER